MTVFKKIFAAVLGAAFLACGTAGAQTALRWDVRPGYGVTELKWLSDYNPNLKNTEYDAPVYVMKGREPGATLAIWAGTHAREIAGPIALTVLLENAQVKQGTLFVIPCLNSAGMAVPDELGQVPHEQEITGRHGTRVFYYGDRRIPLKKGEKDPEHFVHPLGYTHKDGAEWRNINRNYPGAAEGTPAQMVCYGVMELLRREQIATCLDVHEAKAPEEVFDPRDGKKHPGGTMSYSLVTDPEDIDKCLEMIMDLEERGVHLKAEVSAEGFRGISHYEIAKATPCIPFLSETPSTAMNEHAVGISPLRDKKHPIEERVGIDMEIFTMWFSKCKDYTGAPFSMEGLPTMQQIQKDGVGAWLN
jgi:hypothetical protein